MGEHSRLDFGDSSPENSLMHSDRRPRPDFSGWASKYGLRCSDGRTILEGAFEHQDWQRIPLVWQHGHASPENVLGHVILEHRDEGPYCYGYFNKTTQGQEREVARRARGRQRPVHLRQLSSSSGPSRSRTASSARSRWSSRAPIPAL
jgi:hypothetical protein